MTLLLCSCLAVLAATVLGDGGTGGSGKACTAERAEIQELKDKVLALRTDFEELQRTNARLEAQVKDADKSKRISIVDLGAQVCGVTSDLASSALESTQADEALLKHLSTARKVTQDTVVDLVSGVVNRAKSIDYDAHWQAVKNSEPAKVLSDKSAVLQPHLEKLQPIVSQARTALQPHLEKVQPTIEAYQPVVSEVMGTATSSLLKAHALAEQHVYSGMRSGSSKMVHSALGRVVNPLFDRLVAVLPQHEPMMPTDPVDRALLLLVAVICLYNALYFLRFCLKWCVRILKRSTLMSFQIFRLAVWLPLKLALKCLGLIWWVATGFYCCGLCKRKKKTSKATVNGKPSSASSDSVTVAEAVKILEQAKNSNNLNKGLKVLANCVKSREPMKKPKTVEGKCLSKSVLLDACKKLGVDTKGLDL